MTDPAAPKSEPKRKALGNWLLFALLAALAAILYVSVMVKIMRYGL